MACGKRAGPQVCSDLAKHPALFFSGTGVTNGMLMNLVRVMATRLGG